MVAVAYIDYLLLYIARGYQIYINCLMTAKTLEPLIGINVSGELFSTFAVKGYFSRYAPLVPPILNLEGVLSRSISTTKGLIK